MKKIRITRKLIESYIKKVISENLDFERDSKAYNLKGLYKQQGGETESANVIVVENPNFLVSLKTDIATGGTGFGQQLEPAAIEIGKNLNFVLSAMNDGTVATTFADVQGYEEFNMRVMDATQPGDIGPVTAEKASEEIVKRRLDSEQTKIYMSVKAGIQPDSYSPRAGLKVTSESHFPGFMRLLSDEAKKGALDVGNVCAPGICLIGVNTSVTEALNFHGVGFMAQVVASRNIHAIYHGLDADDQHVFTMHGLDPDQINKTRKPPREIAGVETGLSGATRSRDRTDTGTVFLDVKNELRFEEYLQGLITLTQLTSNPADASILTDIADMATSMQQFLQKFCNDGRRPADIPVFYFGVVNDLGFLDAELDELSRHGAIKGFSTYTPNQERVLGLLNDAMLERFSESTQAYMREFIRNMQGGDPNFQYIDISGDFMADNDARVKSHMEQIMNALKVRIFTRASVIQINDKSVVAAFESFKRELGRLDETLTILEGTQPFDQPRMGDSPDTDKRVLLNLPALIYITLPGLVNSMQRIMETVTAQEKDGIPDYEGAMTIYPEEQDNFEDDEDDRMLSLVDLSSPEVDVGDSLPTQTSDEDEDEDDDNIRESKGGLISMIKKSIKESLKLVKSNPNTEIHPIITELSKFLDIVEDNNYPVESKLDMIYDMTNLFETYNNAINSLITDYDSSFEEEPLRMVAESKLYESIIESLIEVSNKKHQNAHQPKKIKINRKQLNALIDRHLK